jgi:hypothetical protein
MRPFGTLILLIASSVGHGSALSETQGAPETARTVQENQERCDSMRRMCADDHWGGPCEKCWDDCMERDGAWPFMRCSNVLAPSNDPKSLR